MDMVHSPNKRKSYKFKPIHEYLVRHCNICVFTYNIQSFV